MLELSCIDTCLVERQPTLSGPECDLEYAHGGMAEREVGLALTNSFGFGGHNASLLVKRFSE